MSEQIVLNATRRDNMGKGASRRLRREGLVPAIVYGGKKEPVSITFEQREVQKALKNEGFYSQIVTVKLENKTQKFILKDIQRHPFKSLITHLDFARVSEDQELIVHVPIHYLNEETSIGVKQKGGIVSHHLIDIEIKCLPANLPEFVEIDLANLDIDQTIHLSDLNLPKGTTSVALSHEDNKAVVSINLPKAAPAEEEETVEAAAPEASDQQADVKSDDSSENSENSENNDTK